MSPKTNTTKLQKIILIGLIALGLFFILAAVLPELLSHGEKGLGSTQMLFLRSGSFFFIAGLIALFFPGITNYLTQTFNDSEYQYERTELLTVRPSFAKNDFILLFLFLLAANFFTIYFIGRENTIYDWDAAHFWSKYVRISNAFKDSPVHAVKLLIASIQHGEYNYVGPFLLMPFALLFGVERLPFILSIVNIFGLLSAFSFLFLYKRFAGIMYGDQLPYSAIVLTLFTFFAFPLVWAPILFGYVALGGFFIICLILFLYFKYPLSAHKYRTLMLIGILLPVMVIFRRWYSFWAVSFIITLVINELIFLFIDYGFDRKRLIVLAKKILFIAVTSGIVYIIVSGPRLFEVLTKDYTALIVAYNPYKNILGHFKTFLSRFGPFHITLSLLGLIVAFYYRETRRLASFLIIQLVITFALFTRISLFTYHHYYLLQPTILLFIAIFMTALLLKAKSKIIKTTICSVYISFSIIIFVAVFIPEASSYANQAKGLFPKVRNYPMVREDIDEVKRMLNVLGGILAGSDDYVYVLSGTERLNSDHIEKGSLSLKGVPLLVKHTFRTHDLDLRDGFPSDLFKAKYVVIADPIQCGLGCNKMQVISTPAKAILNGENMGTSYKKLPYEFTLIKGIKVYIYERTVSSVKADIDFLSDTLRELYPDNPKVYKAYAE